MLALALAALVAPISHGTITVNRVYRAQDSGRVRLFILVGMKGRAWKLRDGNAIFATGGIGRLYQHFGMRVHRLNDKSDGSLYYYVNGRYRGRAVRTSFQVDRFSRTKAHVLDVYVDFAD